MRKFINFRKIFVCTKKGTPLIFTKPTNFKIRSVGEYAGASRQIEAVVYDVGAAVSAIADSYKKEKKDAKSVTNNKIDRKEFYMKLGIMGDFWHMVEKIDKFW